jgi:hypothetical protein
VIATLVATGRRRSFEGAPARILTLLAAAFACWVIYANVFVISDPLVLGILFVSGILTLLFPVIGHSQMAPNNPTIIDWLLSGPLNRAAWTSFAREPAVHLPRQPRHDVGGRQPGQYQGHNQEPQRQW